MIRHVILLKLREGTTDAQRRELIERLNAMKDEIPELKDVVAGAALLPGTHEVAMTADLEDVDAFNRYMPHPVHQRLIKDVIEPYVADVAVIQIPLGGER